jgi:pimeloyl-ACP methyl ester carboxylesterase
MSPIDRSWRAAWIRLAATWFICVAALASVAADDLLDAVQHKYAANPQDHAKIHYVSVGEGPLVVFVHGFPDFWYSWSHQIETLADNYRCVALDLRGYNLSDKPEGLPSYDMSLLVQDVIAVIGDCGANEATVVAHDWGGAIAWALAMNAPQYVKNLVICNLPHPRGLRRELLINDEHRAGTEYARNFQDPDFHKRLSADGLVTILKDQTSSPWSDEKAQAYRDAFERSDFKAMLSYYRQNYNPKLQEKAPLPYEDPSPVIKVQAPVLMFHGLGDKALHHHALNNTWEWVEKDLTIVTLPDAGHWVHHDKAEVVSMTLRDWLGRHR